MRLGRRELLGSLAGMLPAAGLRGSKFGKSALSRFGKYVASPR